MSIDRPIWCLKFRAIFPPYRLPRSALLRFQALEAVKLLQWEHYYKSLVHFVR